MGKIDCFLIGHNEFSIAKSKRMMLYLYGKQSIEYRDRIKYNLSQTNHESSNYSPVDLFNHFRKEQGVDTSTKDLSIITESFNLAVAYLGNYLHKNDLTFDFINGFQEEKDRLKQALIDKKVRTIGIITTYYLSHHQIHDIISFVRKFDSDVKIIVGGPFVINKVKSMTENKISDLFRTIRADYFVQDSSGEDILVDLIKSIKSESSPEHIRNLYYKDGDSYSFTFEKIIPFDFAVNQIDWELFRGRLAPVLNLRTAVSCPFKCAFCNYPMYAGKYGMAPLDMVERELQQLKAQGVEYIQFVDDTFNVPKKRFSELLRMMIRNEFNFKWSSYFKCQYADAEVIKLMKESGCQYVFLGIESGSQVILDNMNKKSKVEIYRECMDMFNEIGIMTMCSIVVGFPGETQETFQETFDFIEESRPTFYQQRLWWYDRTAPIHMQREKFSLEGGGYSWNHATMETEEAHELADKMFLNIKNSIHITEYALPFFLLGRNMNRQQVKDFLRNYMYCNRERYLNPNSESPLHYIESISEAVRAGETGNKELIANF